MGKILAVLVAIVWGGIGGAAGQVTTESLLREMTNPAALARWPEPAYTCRQFSSYDRASVSASEAETWFANGDAGHFLRLEQNGTRKEWVLAEMAGPGAVVRVWSANPKGMMRVYVDGQAEPVIEAPMEDLLGGKWKIAEPMSHEASRGWNLYLPIPYAQGCKVTSDEGGFYYQVNYRTYPAGTEVLSFQAGDADRLNQAIESCIKQLQAPAQDARSLRSERQLGPGESLALDQPGPDVLTGRPAVPGAAVVWLGVRLAATDIEQASRSVVIVGEFDGAMTIWCPVGDFFGSGVGVNPYGDLYRKVVDANTGEMSCRWVMPFRERAKFTLINLGQSPVNVAIAASSEPMPWDDRSMHFHARWRSEYPIHAAGGCGTVDWNYLTVSDGQGVFVGDNLAIMNPVPDWWGEGDEKIYVDGEAFPSHFGTGTEDYYGYAWCSPKPFVNPFHSQPRCDGWNGGKRPSNWGHTTVTRVRALDAIPFTKSLRFDMEVWHWKACDLAFAATTYFYARPGAVVNREPDEAAARAAIPKPPSRPRPMTIAGAVECEVCPIVARSNGLAVESQDMEGFARDKWSDGGHLWVQGRRVGDFVELEVPVPAEVLGAARTGAPVRVSLHATRSWDYGIVQFDLNGRPAGKPVDFFSGGHGKVMPTGAIDLGEVVPREGTVRLRAEVVGGNEEATGTRAFFGLDCVVMTATEKQ